MKVYLATPYTGTWRKQEARAEVADKVGAKIMLNYGYAVFSPISQSHRVSRYLSEETDNWDFWQRQDLPFLEVCDELWVILADGTKESVGVRAEIKAALSLRIPVRYITINEDGTIDVSKGTH